MENGFAFKGYGSLTVTFKLKTTFPVQEMLFFNAQELVTTHLAVESYNWVEWLVLLSEVGLSQTV